MSAEKLAEESARWMASRRCFIRSTRTLGATPFAKMLDGMGERARAGFAAVRDAAIALDKLYIPTRYPDALPDTIPADAYTRVEIQTALSQAAAILSACEAWLAQG